MSEESPSNVIDFTESKQTYFEVRSNSLDKDNILAVRRFMQQTGDSSGKKRKRLKRATSAKGL